MNHCQLCGKKTKLCMAHLFPKAMRKFVSDDRQDPHFYAFAVDGSQRDRKLHTLPFDRNILCAECDSYLGDFDNAFVRFLTAWQIDPRRERSLTRSPNYQTVRVKGDAAKIRLGILASLFRYALSELYPWVSLPSKDIAHLKEMLLQQDVTAEGFPVLVAGYYRCDMMLHGRVIDVTEIGRPHPGTTEGGFFFELFGTSVHISVQTQPTWPRLSVDFGGEMVVGLRGVEKSSPSFLHMYRHMLEAGAVIVPKQVI